ncbi:MAG: DUF1800 family protein, partial [Bryocella sp.]
MTRTRLQRLSLETGKAVIVSSLCSVLFLQQTAFAADTTAIHAPRHTATRKAPLTQNEKVLHTLNRLAFGPTPGEEATVRKMGLDAWFEQQLNPDTIPDTTLDAKLAELPALQMSIAQLYARYPSPNMLKRMSETNAPLPADPVVRAIYADSMLSYNNRIKGVEAKKDVAVATPAATPAAVPQESMAKNVPAGEEALPAGQKLNAKGKRKFAGRPMPSAKLRELMALAPEDRFNALVAMSPEEMVSFRRGMRTYSEAALINGMTPQQKQDIIAMEGGIRVIAGQALEARLLRDVYSDRQLQAVMDDFWLNHFSVYVRKNQNEPYLLASYERDTILPNALGNFETLLVATAKSPAMLMYLDNWLSIGP